MATLTSKQRDALPASAFVFPSSREYPIQDVAHARNALARGAQNETGSRLAAIKAAVYKKYPQLKPGGDSNDLSESIGALAFPLTDGQLGDLQLLEATPDSSGDSSDDGDDDAPDPDAVSVKCPSCGRRGKPNADGDCPNCGQDLSKVEAVAQRMQAKGP